MRRLPPILHPIGSSLLMLALAVVLSGAILMGPEWSADHDDSVIAAMHARHEAATRVQPFDSLGDVMANTRYVFAGRAPRPLTQAVVIGDISDVQRGRGFYVEGNDAPDGIQTHFDDRQALWRTVHATFNVTETVSGWVDGTSIRVGFAFSTDVSFDSIRQQFLAFDDLVLFLDDSAVFSYDEHVIGVALDGALIATVAPDGTLDLPVLAEDEAATLLSTVPTVERLRQAAAMDARVFNVDADGRAYHSP